MEHLSLSSSHNYYLRPGWVSTTEEPIKFSCPLSITTLCWCCHLLHCPNYAEIGQLLLLMQHVLSALNHGCLDGSKHCSGLTSSHSALILSLGSICCILDSIPNKTFLKPTPYLQFVWYRVPFCSCCHFPDGSQATWRLSSKDSPASSTISLWKHED